MNKITFEVRNGVTYCLLNGVVIGQATKAELGMTEEEVLELIEGNPDMDPTEVLEKIKIGDTVFSVVGGEEVDSKIDASHLYIIDDTDFLPNNQISERFKHIINVHATFKYNGTNGDAIAVNNSSAIGLTFIPVADEHVSEGFPKLYQTTFISVDTGRPEVDIIAFTLNNNEFSSLVESHFTYPYNQVVAPQLLGDTDNYVIFNDMLMIPSIATQLQNAAGQDMISGMKIFNIQLLDNNNLINTLPEETKIVFGDINVQESFMVIDVKSSVSLTVDDLTAPVMTVGSIKRFRVSDTDPVLKDSYIFSAYPMIGQNALVVLTERDTNGGGGEGASNCMYELRSNGLKFYDVNGEEISTELTKFAFRFSEAGFEELKEKVNPLLLEMGASILTDFNSLVTFLNATTQETVASTSNFSVIILTLLASYTIGNYWLDSIINPITQQVIPNSIYSNIFFMYLGIQVVTASGAQNTLIQLVDNSTGNMVGINATWEFSQYGSSSGGGSSEEQYYEVRLSSQLDNLQNVYETVTLLLREADEYPQNYFAYIAAVNQEIDNLNSSMGLTIPHYENIRSIKSIFDYINTLNDSGAKKTLENYAMKILFNSNVTRIISSYVSQNFLIGANVSLSSTYNDGLDDKNGFYVYESGVDYSNHPYYVVYDTETETLVSSYKHYTCEIKSFSASGNGGSSVDNNNAYKIVFSAEKDETYTDGNEVEQTASLKRDFEFIILKNQEQEIVSTVNQEMQTNFTSISEIAQMINQQISTLGNTDSSVLQLYGQSIFILGSITKVLIDFSYDTLDAEHIESARLGSTIKEIYDLLGLYPLVLGTAFTRVSNVVVSDYSFGGGGSSASESYYKIVLEDECYQQTSYTNVLTIFIYKEDLTNILTAINTQMGTSLSTPQDLITFYDSVKGNINYETELKHLFSGIAIVSKKSNLRCLYEENFDGWLSDAFIIQLAGITIGDGTNIFNMTPTDYNTIGFTSTSTLTITEQTNQKI